LKDGLVQSKYHHKNNLFSPLFWQVVRLV